MNTAHTQASAGHITAAAPSQLAALRHTNTGRVVLVLAASAFVAACAHVSIPLPFTPVPLTLSDLAVLLVGLALGPSLGFAALVAYLAEGAAGLPVFNPGGPLGIARLVGPTAGYLLAYPFAAAIAGFVARTLARRIPRFGAALTACLLATSLLMLSGAVWLGHLLHAGPRAAFLLGALPFLPGQAVKVLAAAGVWTAFARHRRA